MTGNGWDAHSPMNWAQLGLVHVPLFPVHRAPPMSGTFAVLMDGNRVSFALFAGEAGKLVFDDAPLSWSWSANLRHAVFLDDRQGLLLLRRWDQIDAIQKFKLPTKRSGGATFLEQLESAPPPRTHDVMVRMLRAFRQIRAEILRHNDDPINAIRIFNAFLTATERAREGGASNGDIAWLRSATVGEALGALDAEDLQQTGADALPRVLLQLPIGRIPSLFLDRDPASNCYLDPELLIRHAAGALYQEAHFDIERTPQLSLFPGFAEARTIPSLKRDVRFTPPTLARLLVQQALAAQPALLSSTKTLEILDPACGSGVFLQESLREVAGSGFSGKVLLRGYDTSGISCEIARFCLYRAAKDAESPTLKVEVAIKECDALTENWGCPDVIAMNPPFVPYSSMDGPDRERVQAILGNAGRGRVDKAMAFVQKAAEAVHPAGAVSCILPSPLLETDSGEAWRQDLSSRMHLDLIGRFRGYGFFPGATVEPAFLTLTPRGARESGRVCILIAEEGAEDRAVRALRQSEDTRAIGKEWEIYPLQPESMSAASWLPRPRRDIARIEQLKLSGLPTIARLFEVKQGIRTGLNKAFVLSLAQLTALPPRERKLFRAAVGAGTIRNGRIFKEEFVFYPYSAHGATINSEEELRAAAPRYFADYLLPNISRLKSRANIDPGKWWLLTRPRDWQFPRVPKLVSTYFGEAGSFAYDDTGEFVVLQGFAWLWREVSDHDEECVDNEPAPTSPFAKTDLPLAYLALFNSPIFEDLLGHFCPRVQGGQFNLSDKFVGKIFAPNLADETATISDAFDELVRLGRGMSSGKPAENRLLTAAAARAYGISSTTT